MTNGFPNDREIRAEAAMLLRGLTVSTSHGATARGDNVHVLVQPDWDEDSKSYSLSITCYPIGQRLVNWGGLPIMVTAMGETGLPAMVVRLGQRGQALIPGIPEGDYHVSASECWSYSETPVIHPAVSNEQQAGTLTAESDEGHPQSLAASERQAVAAWPELLPTLPSNDSRVIATLEYAPTGVSTLTFETEREELAGARVCFAIVRTTGEAEFTGEVTLSPVEDRSLWSGRWIGRLKVTEPCHLMFEVFPVESTCTR